jgi:hypothetical protein
MRLPPVRHPADLCSSSGWRRKRTAGIMLSSRSSSPASGFSIWSVGPSPVPSPIWKRLLGTGTTWINVPHSMFVCRRVGGWGNGVGNRGAKNPASTPSFDRFRPRTPSDRANCRHQEAITGNRHTVPDPPWQKMCKRNSPRELALWGCCVWCSGMGRVGLEKRVITPAS